MPSSQRVSNILFYMSRKPQAAYTTAVTPNAVAPTSHIQVLCERDASRLQYSPRAGDNSADATGVDEPTDYFVLDHNSQGNIQLNLDLQQVVRNYYAQFGGLSSAVLAAAAAPDPQVVEHTITRMDLAASLQLPAYELGYDAGNPISRRFLSMCSQSLAITIVNEDDNNPKMRIVQGWQGSGLVYEPSSLIWAPTSNFHVERISAPKYLTRAHAYARIGDYDGSGGPVSGSTDILTDCTLRSLSATFTNEFSPERTCPGAGRFFYTANGILWKATTAVNLNDLLVVGGRIYNVTTGGTTAASAPTHTSGTAANGSAQLAFVNFRGVANWAATTPVLLGELVTHNDRLYKVSIAGTTGSTGPSHTSGTATDGSATLKFMCRLSESGEVGSQLLLTRRTQEIVMVVEGEQNSEFFEHARCLKPFDLEFGGIGGLIRAGHNYQLIHHLYKVVYDQPEETPINGLFRMTIRIKPILDTVQNKVLDIKIRNTQSNSEYV